MPILPPDASEADRRRAADAHEQRADRLESPLALLALRQLALERTAIAEAIARARSDRQVREALAAIVDAYRSPSGLFRREWERQLGEMAREAYRAEARRVRQATAQVTGRAAPAPTAAQLARLDGAADARAAGAAREICETSAARIEAVAGAVAPLPPKTAADRAAEVTADISASPGGPGGGPPHPGRAAGASTPRSRVIQQRIDTLAPILGREAAEQIVTRVAATLDAGQHVRGVARELAGQVTATEITRKRAVRIARTESIGLLNAAERDAVKTAGILRRKRWLDQGIYSGPHRVRDSHQRCARQGIIPIDQRFVNGLDYPGERPAPAEEVINCRCAASYLP